MHALLTHDGILVILQVFAAAAGVPWLALQLVTTRERLPSIDDPHTERRWFWIRWCAMIAFLAAWGIVAVRSSRGVPFRVPSMTLFMTSVVICSLQWFHVWFVAWPSLRTGGLVARRRTAAALAVNRATTIPLVFFFVAASWATGLGGHGRWIPEDYWFATTAIYGGLGLLVLALPGIVRIVLAPWPMSVLAGAALASTVGLLSPT